MKRIIPMLLTGVLAAGLTVLGIPTSSAAPITTVEVYDDFDKPGGYTLLDYTAKWLNKYGIGEMAFGDTRRFENGAFDIRAVPFKTSSDAGILDHIKYIALSQKTFPVPQRGSIEFSVDLTASTPGTEEGHVIHGTYGPPLSYPLGEPYQATLLEGQQAAATLHMIDFETGQLFDWFVSSTKAFTLIERLPSAITNPAILPTDERYVGRDKMYTQIVDEVPLSPGTHTLAIRFSRDDRSSKVEYFLDRRLVSRVNNVGVPLDVQGVPFTGTYPSLGPGEPLHDKLDSAVIGHGLFSLLDQFPFHHPEALEHSVSIPTSERLFGQGAHGTFDNFVVTTTHR